MPGLSREEKEILARLEAKIEQMADRLNGLDRSLIQLRGQSDVGSAFSFGSPQSEKNAATQNDHDQRHRSVRPALPDPRLVRRIIRQRQLRARFFDGELFGDPAWDMLLDLTAARVEHQRVSITSLCIASGVPPTTALRWINEMTSAGLLERVEDDTDRRRSLCRTD